MKKILFIINDNLSANARSLYEINSLASKNNLITVICDEYKPKIKFLKKKNIKIIIKGKNNNFFNKFFWFVFLIDFEWLKFLTKNKKKFNFEIIHLQNNYLFKTIFKFLILINKKPKIILDIHDSLPESFISWNKDKNIFKRLFYLPFTNIRRLRNYEFWSITKSVATLVTTLESKKKILNYYSKYLKKKINIIENLETLFFQKKFKTPLRNSSILRVIYFGSFAPHRGLETIIDTSKLMIREKVEFYLIGASNNYYSKKILKNKSKNLKILKRINLNKLKNYTNTMSIGIVPHIKNMHTNTTIPYKLSQYMGLGIPQIVTNCDPIIRTIKKSKSGLIYKYGDPNDLKKTLKKINKLKIINLRLNSLKYFKKNNWELKEHKKILEVYEKVQA